MIERHQMMVGVVTKAPDNATLNSSYETRFAVYLFPGVGRIARLCEREMHSASTKIVKFILWNHHRYNKINFARGEGFQYEKVGDACRTA